MPESTPAPGVPIPATPGPEMAALARFARDVTWEGTIEAGGMGPGTPAMPSRGRGVHRLLQSGRWIAGEYEQDQFLSDGTFVLKWELHWVMGWSPAAGGYVATFADCYGNAGVLNGHIDGDDLVFESPPGAPVGLRLTWHDGGPDDFTWRNEMSVAGGPWMLVEEYRMHPV